MAKKLKEMNENSDKEGDMLGKAANDGPLVTAIKQRQVVHHNENDEIGVVFRYKDNKEGRMNSVFYLILQVRHTFQISDLRVPVTVQSMVDVLE